ncbi:hypothetical protein [Nitratifractor salsuginis]|uniref:Uncharacterized protein n=1 Tax=Nitratifractor salsuginis (strain DSM 16511 / JCM 12458 / E9I37-1) TaxID=749222 RepID=E6X0N0_NITSE|nr:hypothetical protein [Nitratifractor salsuginis]ADV45750.1 hypothetical protein Nitsa_0480 [Nitratifractor salsuginis DSM 16511]
MADKFNEIATLPLSSAEKGKIEVAVIEEPYGAGSEPVASIGIFLDGSNEEPDWKVHIPKENIDGVIEALKKAKEAL